MILRNVLSQFFIVKCFSKSLLVRTTIKVNEFEFNTLRISIPVVGIKIIKKGIQRLVLEVKEIF